MNGRWTFDAGEQAGEDAVAREVLCDKLDDALTPGYQVAFAPGEAERAGAFMEHALSEQDAADSDIDLVDARDRPAGDGKEQPS